MKKIIFVLALVCLGFTASELHAAVIWDGEYDQFRYAVDNNGGFFFKEPSDFQEANPKDSSTNAEGESGSFEDIVSTHTSQINNTIQLDALAQGTGTAQSPPDGVDVKGYARILLNGFDSAHSGVDVTQTVVTWVTRRFTVDTEGTYTMTGLLNGLVDFNEFGDPAANYFSSYSVSATATIDAYESVQGEPGAALPWNLPELSLVAVSGDGGNRSENTDVVLLPQAPGGSGVIYEIRAVLTIQSRLQNLSLVGGTPVVIQGSAPFEGPFGLGQGNAPLDFQVSLAYAAPLPNKPVFLYVPPDTTAECGNSDPSHTGSAQAVSACNDLSVTWSDQTTPGPGGGETITRTWTATACNGGESTSAVQTITAVDTTPPVFTTQPPDITVECGESTDPASTGQAQATDACSNATVTYTDSTSQGSCEGTEVITRTWTATDDADNTATYVQTITVQDSTAPTWVFSPANVVTAECGESTDPGSTGQAQATDTCSNASVTYTDSVDPSCGNTETITRTWNATDACGNAAAALTQTIHVVDTTAPQFTYMPPDLQVYVGESTDPAATGTAQGTDACGNVTVAYSDSWEPGSEQDTGVITRTWTATDECGNSASGDQLIQVVLRDYTSLPGLWLLLGD